MIDRLVAIHDETTLHGSLAGHAKSTKKIVITLVLRPAEISEEVSNKLNRNLNEHPSKRSYLNHEELARYTSFSKEDKDLVEEYLKSFGFESFSENPITRELTCRGTVEEFESAFHSKVGVYHGTDGVEFISAISGIYVPEHISELIYSFKGFIQKLKKETRKPTKKSDDDDEGWSKGFSIEEIISAYQFPKEATGNGQCIGIVELGGRYSESDLKQFFSTKNMPVPEITVVGEDPGDDSDINNGEVSMDLQIIGAIAPEAKLVVYYAKTFIDALKMIVRDDVHCPSVVSISWSAPEEYYNETEKKEFDQLLYQAALLGITVIGSSGDHGAYNNLEHPNVPLPACHPLVLGCGGTIINIEEGVRKAEMVWNEFHGGEQTGGGFSNSYDIPDYQVEAISKYPYIVNQGRGVPDVAALSSTIDGFQVVLDGDEVVVGGTSTATPMWAALTALLNECVGYRLGFFTSLLYKMADTEAFGQITQGNNTLYNAAPYWNPCTGLGSPNGSQILDEILKQENNSEI